MSYLCPKCQREIYNRRLTHCGFCGAPIPEGLRFTPEQMEKLDREMAELDDRRRKRQLEADKVEKERKQREADGSSYF